MDNKDRFKNQRYDSLISRSFKAELELFLFKCVWSEGNLNNVNSENFLKFLDVVPNDEIKLNYKKACLLKGDINLPPYPIKMKDIDKEINNWYKSEKELKEKLKDNYAEIFKKNKLSEKDFIEFYNTASKCNYCGISLEQITKLIDKDKIYTKRLLTRGKTLEIDRKDPNGDYNKDNIVLCCYWCNNAKTDEFTKEDFHPIALKIREVWNKRIRILKLNEKTDIDEIS